MAPIVTRELGAVVCLVLLGAALGFPIGYAVAMLTARRIWSTVARRDVRRELVGLGLEPRRASQCEQCDRVWAPWIWGPHVGEPCTQCGRRTTEREF